MNTQNIEEIPLEELEKKLNEYKTNLSQVEAILEREKTNNPTGKLDEIYKLQKDLKQAIIYQDEVIKFKIQQFGTDFSDLKLEKSLNGKLCQAYYEAEGKWFNALIHQINEAEQTAEVTYLGYKDKEILQAKFIKLIDSVSFDELEPGMHCDAIYMLDGLWYQSQIEQISQHGVHVKYKQFEEVEVVPFEAIRISPEQKIQNEKRKEFLKKKREPEEELEFKIPEHLKISPADNEAQRLAKKKKIKALKNTHKQKQIEKFSKEKQDDWLSFSQKNKAKPNSLTSVKKYEDTIKSESKTASVTGTNVSKQGGFKNNYNIVTSIKNIK